MQLGLVGLGKMGFNMRQRLREGGHEVIGFDPRPEVSDTASLAALAEALTAPRVVWVMVPSGPITDETIVSLAEVLSPGDLVIDGGNSRYTEDAPHAELLGKKGISFVDAGVSGGRQMLQAGGEIRNADQFGVNQHLCRLNGFAGFFEMVSHGSFAPVLVGRVDPLGQNNGLTSEMMR